MASLTVVKSNRPTRFRWKVKPALWRGVLSLISAAIIWELTATYLIKNRLFFAPLSAVAVRLVEMYQEGILQTDILASMQTFVVGFVLGSTVAILLGVLMALSDWARDFLDPWISAMYATPYIALAPLFVLWLGIGLASHAAVVFLGVFFPVLINTYSGLATTDRILLEVARSYNANERQLFTKVRFPAALPYIITGLRLGVARGLVGVVVAEIFGARAGLGYRLLISGNSFDTAGLFAGIFLFAFAGVISVEILKIVERRLAPWRFQANEE
ncbi:MULTISPECIES: ABC transporter permease [unclassified Beijerinckia]|uniref:ABC transporter permease n=1 Tax=unclassified Beijerinckia TaxID=2638183 RepID=UPI00089D6C40|nr:MULTISPECIES: ABC transporter permease [unclassified Beijerinckia]MDH7794275.1 NitT/TauT family transport system permease protein [Beijerinckia sp. GAS462]SEB57535.1 NitT/TauT family transport system permease protein [Beijerinckia sp. 28-YEA-48]